MADYLVGSGEGAAGVDTPLPWSCARVVSVVDDNNSSGSAATAPVGFPLDISGLAADGSCGDEFSKIVYTPVGETNGGVSFSRFTPFPTESSQGLIFERGVLVSSAECAAGTIATWTWCVGLAEVSEGIIAERPAIRHRCTASGVYRIFNEPEYRLYRSRIGPPSNALAPFATSSSLPVSPSTVFSDGTWYVSVSYFNGLLDSGFLPLGIAGETYVQIEVAGGQSAATAPTGPYGVTLTSLGGGVIQVSALYYEDGSDRASEWAIGYTVDGSEPPEGDPNVAIDLPPSGLAILDYAFPAVDDGTTITVRLQTRRNDGTDAEPNWVYSDVGTIVSLVVDAVGPGSPLRAEQWAGALPVED